MSVDDLYRLLRTGHVQAQGIVDTIDEPLIVLDQNFRVLNANRAFLEKFLVDRDDILGQNFFGLSGGQWDVPELRALLASVIPKSVALGGFEVTHDFAGLGRRTMLISARRLIQPDGNGTSMLLVFQDVTESRRVEAAKNVLLAEAQHRLKNLLTVVRSLAAQTPAEDRTGPEYRDAFLGRLDAVLKAQSVFGDTDTDLATIIAQTFELPGPSRARIDPGPPVSLGPAQVMPVAMILHELTTNAMKYGAHSTDHGQVTVTWNVITKYSMRLAQIDWREEGGPPVTVPESSGFGTSLIQFSASKSLGGTAELRYEPSGLQARIAFPLE